MHKRFVAWYKKTIDSPGTVGRVAPSHFELQEQLTGGLGVVPV